MTTPRTARPIAALLLGFFIAVLFGVYTTTFANDTRFGGVIYTWPTSNGVGGKLLKTNGSKVLSWDGDSGVPSVPAGVVLYTASTSCPTGWAEYGASGEYFVGASTSLESTVGTALSNLENRAAGTHGHTVSSSISTGASAHDHSFSDPGHEHGGEDDFGTTDLVGEGAAPRSLGSGNRSGQLAVANVAGNISIGSGGGNASVANASATVTDYAGYSGTNAPYIQLRACRKS
jgi:hypothetical protein